MAIPDYEKFGGGLSSGEVGKFGVRRKKVNGLDWIGLTTTAELKKGGRASWRGSLLALVPQVPGRLVRFRMW
jgi:hypothetical protein